MTEVVDDARFVEQAELADPTRYKRHLVDGVRQGNDGKRRVAENIESRHGCCPFKVKERKEKPPPVDQAGLRVFFEP
jgi:hypothetical protein